MKAHEILSRLEYWGTGRYAQAANGEPETITSQFAICFCAAGAIRRKHGLDAYALNRGEHAACLDDFRTLANHLSEVDPHRWPKNCSPEGVIIDWNDISSYEFVYSTLKALDI